MQRAVLIPLIVACALFMENMDSTVITTSLPAIAADIGENPLALKLALTSYLVSLAVFIPISGWVADRYGSRTVFSVAIIVFVGGSLLCALSNSLPAFIAARFVQGMGGAMMVPVGRLVLMRAVPKQEYVSALNYLTIPALMGPVIGPALGGAITLYFHWRWIFIINVPIGILGLVLVQRHIPNLVEETVPPFDWRGFTLCGIGLSVLMLGLSALGGHLLSDVVTAASIAGGAIILLFYVAHARRTAHPSLDLRMFRVPTFFNGVAAGSLFRIGVGATPFLLPLLLQLGFGLEPPAIRAPDLRNGGGRHVHEDVDGEDPEALGLPPRVDGQRAPCRGKRGGVRVVQHLDAARRDRYRPARVGMPALAPVHGAAGVVVRRYDPREHEPGDEHRQHGAAAGAKPRHRRRRLRARVVEPRPGARIDRRRGFSAGVHRRRRDRRRMRGLSPAIAAGGGNRGIGTRA